MIVTPEKHRPAAFLFSPARLSLASACRPPSLHHPCFHPSEKQKAGASPPASLSLSAKTATF
jgi:hypothetical protein